MVTEPVVAVCILRDSDRIEITLRAGFTRAELDVVRGLPGRRYDAGRRVWSAPQAREAIATLREAFGADRVSVTPGAPGACDDVLERVRIALTVRGYSPRTRKVYLGHLRRFLLWCGPGSPRIPEDPAGQGQAYLLELIERRRISKSYQNQVVSALRFMCESVLGQPQLALRIPRPRKEHRLPTVLSQGEVARMLKRARNPKHRALLMLLYSAGLRVGEVVRLAVSDLDMDRGLVRVHQCSGSGEIGLSRVVGE